MADQVRVPLILDDSDFRAGVQRAESGARKGGQAIANSFGAPLTSTFARLGKQVAALGIQFAAIFAGGKVISDVLDFGEAFAEIKTILPDVTQANDALNQSFRDSAAVFGTSKAAQARQFYQIVSAGITDVDKANDLLIQSNKLAIGGLAGTAESIDVLTTAVNSYEKTNLTSANAADILFGTVRLGKVRLSELAASLGEVLPTSSQLGVSFEEVAGAVAKLTQKGDTASIAVTKLNAIFTAVLKKQGAAKKVLGDNAKAFSLQALRTKGLTKFLKDLNSALGGSETKLTKLLGRVEGSKAILSLGADGFKGLQENIDELRNSTGAASAAFEEINKTAARQLKITFANLIGIITDLIETLDSTLVPALQSFNVAIIGLRKNLKLIAIAAGAFLVVFKGAAIASSLGLAVKAVLGLRVGLAGLGAELKLARISTIGMNGVLSTMPVVTKRATAALKGLRIAATLTKAVFTLGLTLAIDAFITKMIELDNLSPLQKVNNGLMEAEANLRSLNAEVEKFEDKDVKISVEVGKSGRVIDRSVGEEERQEKLVELEALRQIEIEALKKLNDEKAAIQKSAQDKIDALAAQARADAAAARALEKQNVLNQIAELGELRIIAAADAEGFFAQSAQTFANFGSAIGETFSILMDGLTTKTQLTTEQFLEQSKAITKGFKQTLTAGVVRGIQDVVKSIAAGENAFEAFGKGVLNLIGSLATQLGQFYIAAGIAQLELFNFSPAGTIAAGVALVALGALFSSFSGGGASAAGGGAASDVEQEADLEAEETDNKPKSNLTVNVQGNILSNKDFLKDLTEAARELSDEEGLEFQFA